MPHGPRDITDDPVDDRLRLGLLLAIGCSPTTRCSAQDEDGQWSVEGNPTDGALLAVAGKAGMPARARSAGGRIDEIPFSSACKYMATLDADARDRRRPACT